MMLSEHCYAYVNDRLSTLSIERSTADDYTKAVRAWIRHIGDMPISDFSEDRVREGLASMVSQGITSRTVSKRYTIMKTLMADAERRGLVDESPFRWVRKPRVADTERNYLPREERDRLKTRLAGMRPSAYVLADMLALNAGLRAEEVCGLKVADIDLDSGMGYVRRAIGREGWRTYEKPTKSRKARDFPLSSSLRSYISAWLDVPPAVRPGADAYLLTFTGEWEHPSKVGRMFSKLAEVDGLMGAMGRRPTFHDLRHTFATACIAAGMDVKTLQSILGHSDAKVTLNVYACADRDAKLAARDVIDAAI